MQVSVEKISNVERRLTITVPSEQIEEAYTKQINQFAKKANIKGFRPGKAPLSYITQRFGDDARKEALSEVIQKALYDAIVKENLKPINTPEVKPKQIEPNQPLEFVASFEVLPEIEQIQFSLDQIEKLQVEIKPEDVLHVIEQLKRQHAQWELVDRGAENTDRVIIDYYAIFEGKEEIDNKIQNFPLEMGSNKMLPGFEEGLLGAKADEERKIQLTFPADFAVQERAGKPIEFVVQVKQVFAAHIPEVNADFIRKLGVKSGKEDDLKTQIQQTLEQERDRLVKEKIKEQIFSKLLEQNPIDVPSSLVAREARNIHDEIYPEHHDHHRHTETEITAFNDLAKKRVWLGILIAEYAKQKELRVDKNRVLDRIKQIAGAYENPQEVVEWLSKDERLAGIEAQVMEDQVMDKLIEGIPVTEKQSNYGDLKGA